MRGRLICPFIAAIDRIDTDETRAAGAYDDDFRTFVPGQRRVELLTLRLPCQIEVNTYELQQMTRNGNAPLYLIQLVFHFETLEREALVHELTGDALIRVGDRLTGIYDKVTNALIQQIPGDGMYARKVEPQGYGIGLKRNLLFVLFEDRAKAVR